MQHLTTILCLHFWYTIKNSGLLIVYHKNNYRVILNNKVILALLVNNEYIGFELVSTLFEVFTKLALDVELLISYLSTY